MAIVDEVKKAHDKFYTPTPTKWRKLGDSINSLGATIQVTLAAMQVSEATHISPEKYFYWVIGIAVTQWAGKTITDFATNGK